MIDDPLALVAAGIWLMAAGMYPIGFLFGACSACCDECPEECNKCTHFYNGTSVEDHGSYTVETISEVLGNGTRTQSQIAIEDPSNLTTVGFDAQGLIDVGFPECVTLTYQGGMQINVSEAISRVIAGDECGCEAYTLEVTITVLFSDEVYGLVFYTAPPQTVNVNSCAGGEFSLLFDSFAFDGPGGDDFESEACNEAVAEWLNDNLSGTIDITVDPCDCGACCSSDPLGCEIAAEGFCAPDDNAAIYREYQGDDTVCDPDPCITGACCADNSCTVTLEGSCPEEGTWYEGVTCDPSPCLGACCDPWAPGGCTETTQDECDGIWLFGSGCEGTCDPPLGSCCDDGDCTETTQDECGGTWTGGQRCDPNPCSE